MPILDLIGAKIKFYDTIPAPYSGKVKAGDQTYDWTSWAEILEPDAGTTVVATHADQFYAGKPAAVTRKLGKGTVTYIGVDSTDGDLEAQLIRDVFTRASVPVENFADGFPRGLARRFLDRHEFHRENPARANSAGRQNSHRLPRRADGGRHDLAGVNCHRERREPRERKTTNDFSSRPTPSAVGAASL